MTIPWCGVSLWLYLALLPDLLNAHTCALKQSAPKTFIQSLFRQCYWGLHTILKTLMWYSDCTHVLTVLHPMGCFLIEYFSSIETISKMSQGLHGDLEMDHPHQATDHLEHLVMEAVRPQELLNLTPFRG